MEDSLNTNSWRCLRKQSHHCDALIFKGCFKCTVPLVYLYLSFIRTSCELSTPILRISLHLCCHSWSTILCLMKLLFLLPTSTCSLTCFIMMLYRGLPLYGSCRPKRGVGPWSQLGLGWLTGRGTEFFCYKMVAEEVFPQQPFSHCPQPQAAIF